MVTRWDKLTISQEDITDAANQEWGGRGKERHRTRCFVMETVEVEGCAEFGKSSYTECGDTFGLTLVELE